MWPKDCVIGIGWHGRIHDLLEGADMFPCRPCVLFQPVLADDRQRREHLPYLVVRDTKQLGVNGRIEDLLDLAGAVRPKSQRALVDDNVFQEPARSNKHI